MQKQQELLSLPKSGGGMPIAPILNSYGGYITSDMLAKSGIYIKAENRGKFTTTKERTGKTTEELTHSQNPLTRKRAVFAQNAAKWNHSEGGFINPVSNDTNSLVDYNAGGRHEVNPLGGIPLGQSAKGKQNTVEQGESSFKFKEGKYVFSNRIGL